MQLAFLHWPVDPEVMRAVVPKSMELDTYDGMAWLGIVPFDMTAGLPEPRITFSRFPEINVRTYVRVGNKTGVFFFSLDATNPLAVLGARTFFYLPYHSADITIQVKSGTIDYRSRRRSGDERFIASYKPVGPVFYSERGSLEYFLTERYCLFTEHRGHLYCCDIHHAQWPLQMAEVAIQTNTMAGFIGADLSAKPHAMYASKLETVEWMLEKMP